MRPVICIDSGWRHVQAPISGRLSAIGARDNWTLHKMV
jgi:hypothetical protein